MSFIKRLFSGKVKETTSAIGGLALDIREAIKGKELDPKELIALESKLLDLQARQIDLNNSEATSRSLFISGWRPFIGWICGIALFCYYIPQFILASYLWGKVTIDTGAISDYPTVAAASSLFELLLGILGLAGLRTYEKKQQISK